MVLTPADYSQRERQEYILSQLHGRYRWEEDPIQKGKHGASYRDMAWDVKTHFGLEAPPSGATIQKDIATIKEWFKLPNEEELSEAARLLLPENFAEWRSKLFVAPNNKPYMTPKHQMALAQLIISLAIKVDVPDWVLEFWELPADLNSLIAQGRAGEMEAIEEMEKVLFAVFVLLAPRMGKSELVLHVLIWLICYNPNIRIIYLQGTLEISKEGMELVKAELESNTELIRLYGPFKSDNNKWNTDSFIVAKRTIPQTSPTFRPVGIRSNIRSIDSDIIIMDDPQSLDRVDSETTGQRDYRWVRSELFTRREAWTPILFVGSHVPSQYPDIPSLIEDDMATLNTESQRVYICKKKAHDTEKCPTDPSAPHWDCLLWPEYRGMGFLDAQRAALTDEFFEYIYQQNRRPLGVSFFDSAVLESPYVQCSDTDPKGKNLPPVLPDGAKTFGVKDSSRSYGEPVTCCGRVVTVLGFDPASGESKGSSYSAAFVEAVCSSCGRRYVVDWWAKRQSPERNPDTILNFVRSYNLRRVRIEINAYMKSLARDPRIRAGERELKFITDEWNTDERKNDPAMGIPMLSRWMRDGYFSFPYKTDQDIEKTESLIKWFKRYPAKPNDIPMAAWLADGMATKWINEMKTTVPGYQLGYENIPPHLREQNYILDLSPEMWNTDDPEYVL